MTPDQQEQMRQLKDHAHAVRIDLSGMLGAGADPAVIEQARWELVYVVQLAEEAMLKGKP